ncbi:MAG: peptidase U32 family protein [Limnochordia bacterium]|jgi:putative protease
MVKPEILAPVGNLEKGLVALAYGADALYMGGPAFGLRARAGNFSRDGLVQMVDLAHQQGARVYITVNIYAHNYDLEPLESYLEFLASLGVDAMIIADPGVFRLAQRYAPQIPKHISTQANVTNREAVCFWEDQGASRINLARELTLEEIQTIAANTNLELEVFVHGAMCIAYSGRCLMSKAMIDRSANRGDCAQSCRWAYTVVEEKRPGEYYSVTGDERASYIFNSRDISMIEHIPQLVASGARGWKIEGRMKSVHYVATVTKAYREARDAYFQNPKDFRTDPLWIEELDKISHRPYGTGFYFSSEGPGQAEDARLSIRSADFLGLVEETQGDLARVAVRARVFAGEELEILTPHGRPFRQRAVLLDGEGSPLEAAHPNDIVYLPIERPLEPFSILRRAH